MFYYRLELRVFFVRVYFREKGKRESRENRIVLLVFVCVERVLAYYVVLGYYMCWGVV